jgi:hypothetical protein
MEMGGDVAVQLLQEFREFRQQMLTHNDRVDVRFSGLEQRFSGIEKGVLVIQEKVAMMEHVTTRILQTTSSIVDKLTVIEKEVVHIKVHHGRQLKNLNDAVAQLSDQQAADRLRLDDHERRLGVLEDA